MLTLLIFRWTAQWWLLVLPKRVAVDILYNIRPAEGKEWDESS